MDGLTNKEVSYEMIESIFSKDSLVLREDELGKLWLFKLIQVTETHNWVRNNEYEYKTNFETWCLNWDAVEGRLSKTYMTFTCAKFPGQRPIKSLPVYPIDYQGQIEGQHTEKYLAERGKKWWEFIDKSPICLQHSGLAFSQDRGSFNGEKVRVEGRVVIDNKSKASEGIETILRSNNFREHNNTEPTVAYKPDDLQQYPKLNDEELSLCPAVIGCYDLKNKNRYLVSINNLQAVDWNEDVMKHLVMDERKKHMLKGLVLHHSNRDPHHETGDLIAGKGQGLVILLHGPPGVGKTLTAESIAEAVRKPLVAMSIGEMVWDETQLQERLKSEFQRAIDWNAVLLLDEADVVLEARSFEDVRRNGIVSIFLRELEYYQGILFLTTNRVSTMDTAFHSRIQIGISFSSMSSETRAQVWTQLLALNGRDKLIGPKGLKRVQDELSTYELNGRQIRNVLNVAEGLAFQEPGAKKDKLTYAHIAEAVEAAAEFQKLLGKSKSMMKLEQTVWESVTGDDDEAVFKTY
ncbi:P-loop containing nucleoside triphosphate hydrolase protein [Trichoderma sp. SZMC 28013]